MSKKSKMFQSTPNSAIGLTINLMSFTISPRIICETDLVRVKIQTIPDGDEQKFDIKAKKMDNCGLIFKFNISNKTEKLLISFMKKTILSGAPVIGNSSLDICDIIRSPTEGASGIKTLDIYYPIERQLQEQQSRNTDRSSLKEKVIGQAKIAISHTEPQVVNNPKDQRKQGRNEEEKLISLQSSSESLF